MSKFKPARVALLASFMLGLILTGIEVLFSLMIGYESELWHFIVFFILVFLVTSFTFRLLYERYILEDLRKIFFNIIRLRSPGRATVPAVIDKKDIAAEINHILIDWSNESKEEIDQLKQVEIYRREFLSNVSHELKTPIFSIQGYVHTLIDGGIEDHDINLLYLNKASRSIDRLISIVDDLESISKLEAGELIIECRTFDIAELARDVVESLELQAKERDVQVLLDHGALRQQYVYADKEMIRQVLVNLIVNSIKYGRSGGKTEVNITDLKDKYQVEVKDNGIGIAKQHLPRLFERFYRVDKSRSREQGGTGLGLAIVKHILEAHGESIGVTSEKGSGTSFFFTIKKSR